MIDMKNRATAAKLPPLDDDMAEHAPVRLAGTQSSTPPPGEPDTEFGQDLVSEPPQAEAALNSVPPEPSPQDLRAIEEGGGELAWPALAALFSAVDDRPRYGAALLMWSTYESGEMQRTDACDTLRDGQGHQCQQASEWHIVTCLCRPECHQTFNSPLVEQPCSPCTRPVAARPLPAAADALRSSVRDSWAQRGVRQDRELTMQSFLWRGSEGESEGHSKVILTSPDSRRSRH